MEQGKKPVDKISVGLIIGGVIGVVIGIGCALFGFLGVKKVVAEASFPQLGEAEKAENVTLSALTGLELENGKRVDGPAYCVQTPNGLDGARPQAGLDEAGVVFEAIAEAGITRFAAIYQEPNSGVIGPIRSLRTYYLDWDTPFDCTIVHAGGAPDALQAVSSGRYNDLDENETYMYRGRNAQRAWNNLFTTGALLAEASAGRSSNIKGFNRMTPEESTEQRIKDGAVTMLDITEPAEGDTSLIAAAVPAVTIDFGGAESFDVNYQYDSETNAYLRSYGSGEPHMIYQCPANNASLAEPESFCELVQVAPSVVVAMKVRESRASDNYHEDIMTTGSGEAYIFQNGDVIEGTWSKASAADQIKFFDASGDEVKLAVGQTWVEAVPNYGGVSY